MEAVASAADGDKMRVYDDAVALSVFRTKPKLSPYGDATMQQAQSVLSGGDGFWSNLLAWGQIHGIDNPERLAQIGKWAAFVKGEYNKRVDKPRP